MNSIWDGIWLTAEQLRYEEWFCSLPRVEQELESERNRYLNGKMTKDQYLDAVGCILFHEELPEEEYERLWNKYGNG